MSGSASVSDIFNFVRSGLSVGLLTEVQLQEAYHRINYKIIFENAVVPQGDEQLYKFLQSFESLPSTKGVSELNQQIVCKPPPTYDEAIRNKQQITHPAATTSKQRPLCFPEGLQASLRVKPGNSNASLIKNPRENVKVPKPRATKLLVAHPPGVPSSSRHEPEHIRHPSTTVSKQQPLGFPEDLPSSSRVQPGNSNASLTKTPQENVKVPNPRATKLLVAHPPGIPSSSRYEPEQIERPRQILMEENREQAPDVPSTPQPNFKHLNLLGQGTKLIKKFGVEATTLAFNFKLMDNNQNPVSFLKNGLDEIIRHVTVDTLPTDRIGMILRNPNFADKPIGFSFRKPAQLSSEVMMAILEKVLQSNARFFGHDALYLHVDRVTLPAGFGRSRQVMTGVSFEEFCRRKTSILVINNNDNNCLAKALTLAIAWRKNDEDLGLLKTDDGLLTDFSRVLCNMAGVDLSNGGNLDHIRQFQHHLTRYTIVVYNHRRGKTVYYEGPRSHDRLVLNLLFENNHFNVITSLTGAFATSYFCEMCKTRTNDKNSHKNCPYICPCCHDRPPCKKTIDIVSCKVCYRDFRGNGCYNHHILKQLCAQLQRCQTCFYTIRKNVKQPHRCGYKYCQLCKCQKPIRHFCYMAQNKPNNQILQKLHYFVFYDFECRQETQYDNLNNTFLHEPNLCVVQTVCNFCLTNDNMEQGCNTCRGARQHIFSDNPVDQLLHYLATLANQRKNVSVIALAHNMRGYDGHFIMKKIIQDQVKWQPKIISTGTKIISITCNNIRFLDTLNFMPMPLSKLPKTFGFPESKGYFPHFFNTINNENYVGKLPEPHYYGPDSMSCSARNEFFNWYNTQDKDNYIFNMQRELVRYCIQDVNILRKATLKFCTQYFSRNNVHPLKDNVATIASACMLVYRRNFLVENTIGLIPHGGYRLGDNQSFAAIKWLLWMEHSEGRQIIHAGNGREVRLYEGILVDGFCHETNTVYQFHGCYFHGCERCFPNQTTPLSENNENETMFCRRERTEALSARIRARYKLIEMWECDFKFFLKYNQEASEFLENNNDIIKNMPLNPRDSFFGGRTNAVKLYHKVADDEEICYFDVISLYPFINKYSKYPLGHPKVHAGVNQCQSIDLTTIEGIIKCCVLAPSQLYHPVLPIRLHGKLMFVLCKTCAKTLYQGECQHTQHERKFIGTYVADELRKAIELGYTVLEIYEVWEYKVTQYDNISKTGGLFAEYVNNFLKLKQESSGFPSWCIDDDSKDRYIQNYYEKEGVQLNKDNISINPGERYNGKICLNSLWGKFGQRENLIKTSVISDPDEFFKIMTDPSKEVHSLIHINDNVIMVTWNNHDEGVEPLATVNVAIAAYTTANARLELYKYLEKLGKRVLYFDTDSVIFTKKPGEWSPGVGDFLGNMTDEIEEYGPGSKITEFVSGGPKNYAYKLFSTKKNHEVIVCKVKGITLNFKNSQTVNFEVMKDMVVNNTGPTYVETDRKIARTSTYDVISKPERKMYQFQYNKRRRIEGGFDTLPYGYKTN